MSDLDQAKLDLPCPNCKRKLTQTIGRLKNNPTIRCPGCQTDIKIEASQLRAAIARIDASLKKLGDSFKRLGKR
jgi:endogenous inhibitor of DNA gyrase (YacG/DUF329 family)